jgi:hypothetical protein
MSLLGLTCAAGKTKQPGIHDYDFQEDFMLEHLPSRFPLPLVWSQASQPDDHGAILAVMAVLGVIGAAALGWLYYRKRSLRTDVEERFKLFRERAVSLMDQLDALRKRHQTLPSTDPDFTVPMSGATQALYDQVNRDLDALWERWLKVMEVWDQTQQRVRADSGLTLRPTEEARALLEGSEIDELVKQSASCKERLDRLNQAHEHAREAVAAAQAQLASVQHEVSKGTGVLLPSDPQHRPIEAAERALGDAEAMLAADPLGALERIQGARESLLSLSRRPELTVAWPHRPPASYTLIDELAAAFERLRAALARLSFSHIFGLLIKVWVAIWVLGLFFGAILPFLIPIILLAVPVIFVAAVARVLLALLGLGRGRRRL